MGYVLKPSVLWDKQHADYGRFNPFEKKKENEYIQFHLKLISGQFLTDLSSFSNNGTGSGSSANNPDNTGMNLVILFEYNKILK